MTTTARTAQMTAHLMKRIAENPNRRDKLHANRTKAIANRDWRAMNDITRRIAKLETK
jgi:hypothetical protein